MLAEVFEYLFLSLVVLFQVFGSFGYSVVEEGVDVLFLEGCVDFEVFNKFFVVCG
jgi:hypothetical protein